MGPSRNPSLFGAVAIDELYATAGCCKGVFMFYDTAKNDHGLPRNPFKSCVVPRPIGWFTSLDSEGRVNLAPYSFFNALADDPTMIMFSANGVKAEEPKAKDTLTNVEATGEFVANLATWDLRQQMVLTSAPLPEGKAESDFAKLELLPSKLVAPPRVAAAPIHMECRLWKVIELPCGTPGQRNTMVIGQVIAIHIDDAIIVDGLVDVTLAKPIARLGYLQYSMVEITFDMKRPPGGG